MNASSSPIKQLTMAAAILAATVGIAGFASSPTREQHRPEDAFHPELPELNKAYLGAVTQSAPGKTKDGRPLQRLTGFFRSERECMPFEAVRTCGCELRVTPRYFLDDGAGNFREIDLDAERVASYGGPGELEGKWLVADCEISPELKHPVMRNFGVVTASTLQIALLQGDSMIMNGMPETAKRAILKGAKPAGFQKMIANAKPYLTVLCRTSDSTGVTPRPAIDYTTNMKSSYPGFNHFVQNMSYGAWNVDGSALVGWINLPKTKSQYLKARDVDGLLQWDHEKLFPDIMPIIDPTVDFSQYAGINIFMNSQDQVAGSAYATYYLVTQDSVDRWMPITQNNGGLSQSVLGHEDGHNFGFDHSSGSYSTPYDSIWDVMSGGSHSVSDPTLGNIRVSNGYNAYHRYKNGWIWRNRVSFFLPGDSRTIRLERLTDPTNATDPLMAKIYIGGSARHYFTVEARKPVGYDESLPSAVVIHDVLEGRFISDPSTTAPRFDRAAQVVDPDMNGDPNDAAAQWVPGESYSDASAGVTISVLSEDSTGFTVNVSVAASAPMPGKITSGGDDGPGTLRNWLYFKKDFPDAAFAFQIPTSDPSYDPVKGFFRIKLKTPLPIITEEGLVIDGASQTAFTGDTNPIGPEVMLDGADTGEYSDGLILKGANQVVRNLSIGNFKSNGIEVDGAADTVIQRCYIGLEPDGTTAAPNGAEGVLIMEGAKRVLVGGLNQGNVISTNHQAVGIWYIGTTGTRILGNLFGTDRTGTLDRGNLYNGVVIAHGASENEVGSKLAGEGNLISGNDTNGVIIDGSHANKVIGNRIGTDPNGTSRIDNGGWGIAAIGTSKDNVIGGTAAGEGNLVSGNNVGIGVGEASRNNSVLGNIIGLNRQGTAQLGNRNRGIYLYSGTQGVTVRKNVVAGNASEGITTTGTDTKNILIEQNIVGTDAAGQVAIPNTFTGIWSGNGASVTVRDNLSSGNSSGGIVLYGAINSLVEKNLIGTDITGLNAIPNAKAGLYVSGGTTNSIVGGTAGLENVVAGNLGEGILIVVNGTTGNHISGNFIGVTRAGTKLGNNFAAIWTGDGAFGNFIGEPGKPNVIAGPSIGISVVGTAATGNRIYGNYIGVLPNGTVLGNDLDGIGFFSGAWGNYAGGLGAGEGNVIAGNRHGVSLNNDTTYGNAVRGNSIYDNVQLGIQIAKLDGVSGVTLNDNGDGDTGPNKVHNFPVLTQGVRDGTGITVTGTFNGASGAQITIDVYANAALDPSGYGEGKAYLGSQVVTTDAFGNTSFNFRVARSALPFITATATGADGSTSEFSQGVQVSAITSLMSVTLPATIASGATAIGSVTLSDAAPQGGLVVSLSSNSTALTVPPSVSVPAGSTTASFSATASTVKLPTDVVVTGDFDGSTQTAQTTVRASELLSVTLNRTTIVGGSASTGLAIVTLEQVAPSGGLFIPISSTSLISLTATVKVAAGSKTGQVVFSAPTPVGTSTNATITATWQGVSRSKDIAVLPPTPAKLVFVPSTFTGGSQTVVTGTVTLSQPAPEGGVQVTLECASLLLTVPASVTVPQGLTEASFTIGHKTSAVQKIISIGAISGGVKKATKVSLNPPGIGAVTCDPKIILGGTGASIIGTVTLNAPAATGGCDVVLTTSSGELKLTPAIVHINQTKSSGTFTITAPNSVPANTAVTITATLNGAKTVIVTVTAPKVLSTTVAPTSVVGGSETAVSFTVNLTAPAPAGGFVVTLASSNTGAASLPASATIPAGATSVSIPVTHHDVASGVTVTLSATGGGVTKSSFLQVKA